MGRNGLWSKKRAAKQAQTSPIEAEVAQTLTPQPAEPPPMPDLGGQEPSEPTEPAPEPAPALFEEPDPEV